MGFRNALIAASVCGPIIAGGGALAQSSDSAAGSSGATRITPAPSARAIQRPPDQPNAAGIVIVTRPPVAVEAEPAPRRVTRRDREKAGPPAPAIAAPPAANGSATGAASGSGQPATAAGAAPQKTWPLVVGAGGAAGAAASGAANGASPAQPPNAWSEAEIKQARTHCDAILKGVDAVITPEDPIKEGECGSPVVYRLSSVSKAPTVELSPPVVLTCEMVATLDKWIKREVQPQARALIGGPVVKIDTMSSYSCRNAYGRTKTRLSEHGKANAIDISGFQTSKDTVTLLAGWGPTQRELKAIAARKEADRAAAAAASHSGAKAPMSQLPQPVQPQTQHQGAGSMTGVPGIVIPGPGAQPGLGLAPTRLGGPSVRDAKQSAPPTLPAVTAAADPKSQFLRQIHAAACRHFGTVLGPEANNAHKNHFHLDMAQRNRGSFCE